MDAESLLPLELWNAILNDVPSHLLHLEFVCRTWTVVRSPTRPRGSVAIADANRDFLVYALELDSIDLLARALSRGLPCGRGTIKGLVLSGRDDLAQRLASLRPRCARRYEKIAFWLRPQPLPRHGVAWQRTEPMTVPAFIDCTIARLSQHDPDRQKLALMNRDEHPRCIEAAKNFVEGRWDALDASPTARSTDIRSTAPTHG
jgi:hypothetical protein